MDMYLGIVKSALARGIVPRCHFEDATRADFYGFVVPFATELMNLSKESGIPIKIRVCDTMGYGVSYPGASLPRSVPGIIYGLRHYAGVPSEQMEWHEMCIRDRGRRAIRRPPARRRCARRCATSCSAATALSTSPRRS